MSEDFQAVQSRIGEIQSRLAGLSRPPAAPSAPAFADALAQVQTPPGVPPSPAPFAAALPPAPRGVSVPPAGLGPMPISPAQIVPLHSSGDYDGLIQTYADRHGLSPTLVKAVIHTESGGDPRAVSPAGAQGLMQLMPANVKEAGIADPFDPEQNIAAGTEQLAGLMKRYGGDLNLTLAGYNAGPGNVHKWGGVPPFAETQRYIRKVRAAMEKIETGGGE